MTVERLDRMPPGVLEAREEGQSPARTASALGLGHITHNFPLLLGLVTVFFLFVITVFGPLWMSHDPYLTGISVLPHFDRESMTFIQPPFAPSGEYPLGTDRWGNDLLSLLVFGARVTFVTAVYITLARLVLGTILGSIAGWYANGLPDRLISGLIAAVTALPSLLVAFILLLAIGPERGLPVFLFTLSVVGWTEVAQFVRGELMAIRQRGFIESAEAAGLTEMQIVVRHVWPNLLPHLLSLTFLEMGSALILIAELGFLGVFMGGSSTLQLEVQLGSAEVPVFTLPEMPEWGALVAQGIPFVRVAPYMLLAPGLAFLITVVGLNSLGEGLRRLLDYTSVSTAFLLRRQMLLVLAAFLGVTVLLLQVTGPRRSYERLAGAFDGARAYAEAEQMARLGPAAAVHMANTLEEYGYEPGYSLNLDRVYLRTFQVQEVQPVNEPLLALLDDSWREVQSFTHGEDFGYRLDGAGGDGEVVGPLTLVHFRANDPLALQLAFDGIALRDRVLLLSQAPSEYIDLALRRGAAGVLVISEDVSSPRYRSETDSRGPVFIIRPAVADALLAQAGQDLAVIVAGDEEGATRVYGDLGVRVHLALHLSPAVEQQFPAVFAFLPGYDQNRAAEIVVVLATFETGAETAQGYLDAAAMLEMARTWHTHKVDPRRSLLLVAWGGDAGSVEELLDSTALFSNFVARVPTKPLRPSSVVHYQSRTGNSPWLAPDGDLYLQDVVQRALDANDFQAAALPQSLQSPLTLRLPRYVYLQWGMDQSNPGQSLDQLGQTLSQALVRMVRENPWLKE